MISPNRHACRSGMHPMDHVPDYPYFRERAHHERKMAINSAFSALLRRFRKAGALTERDASFWTG